MREVSKQAPRNQTNSRLKVIKGVVLNVVERERQEVDSKANLTIVGSTRVWREIEVRTAGGGEFWVSGEVVYGARTGDDIALVFDARGREPLALANLTDGNQFVHSSADSTAKEGKGVWAFAWLIAFVGAIPGLLLFMMLFMIVLPSWTEQNTGQVFKLFPFVLIPASIYAAVRLDRWAVARAKRVHREINEALRVSGATIQAAPPPVPSSEQAKPV